MIQVRNKLKSWFRRGMFPTESQFSDWIDSYWHKTDEITTGDVSGLNDLLNSKEDKSEIGAIANSALSALQQVTDHIQQTDNPHSVTKEQVGLGNCDNTADVDKPISTPTQVKLDEIQSMSVSDIDETFDKTF